MGRQLSVILWVIGIHLLISTGYGSIAPQTRSCSGEFKDAVPEIHSLSDSSALGSSVMVDLAVDVGDRDGVELPEFNQHVGLQVEARDGGVDLEGLSQHRDPHNVGVRSRGPVLEGGIDGRDGLSQHVDLGPGTSLAEVIESESGRQTGSSVALDAVPYYRRRRRSTPGAATSSQVIDLESERQRFNQHVGLQVEARDGGVDLEGLSQHRDPRNVGVRSRGPVLEGGIDGRDGFSQHVDLGPGTSLAEVIESESGRQTGSSGAIDAVPYQRQRSLTSGAATSSQVIHLESERQRFSFGALVIVPCGIWSSQWAVTDAEVPDLESGRQRRSTTGAGTSSQVIDLESGRQRFSSGAPDIAPYGIWSSPWAGTDSEVPDLASGRQLWSSGALDAVPYRRLRWSTPGAGTSSQVIDLESRRESARRLNQRFIKLGFAILLGSTYAITSISVGDQLSPRNRFISNCVLVINIVSFVSLTAANMTLSVVTPSSTPSTDTHTTQTANTILSTLGLAASAYGFILVIAMGLPDHLLWLSGPALIALVFIFVSTSLARRPRI
nr:hypothetical protein CFP56_64541 [Quercus suber]